jgi:ketosteroid isomerase-like protein
MKRQFILTGCLLSLTFVSTASAADSKSADEQALRNLDTQWSKDAGAKNLDKTVSYYSDDAIVLPANAPMATTKEVIRSVWKDLLMSPGGAINWKVAKVEVSNSGDMAYSSGTYELTMNDASGKLVNDRGKYVEIWKKQADKTWKVVVDMWNSDLAAPAPAEKK